jgi:hypothetical protein
MAAKTRSRRVIKRPKTDDYIDLADVVKLCADEEKQRKSEEKKLWLVEEIIDQRLWRGIQLVDLPPNESRIG